MTKTFPGKMSVIVNMLNIELNVCVCVCVCVCVNVIFCTGNNLRNSQTLVMVYVMCECVYMCAWLYGWESPSVAVHVVRADPGRGEGPQGEALEHQVQLGGELVLPEE